MIKFLKNIFSILETRERTRLKKLVFLDALICILDIGFLVILLAVINFYTNGHATEIMPGWLHDLLVRNPMLPIILFFFLFSLKNLMAVYVFKKLTVFTFSVASRISRDNLGHYLDGSYTDYVNIDSSAQTRKISQQPIEFSYYILGGFQQVVNQVLLITLSIAAILVYDAFLFVLLLAILTPPVILCSQLIKKRLAAVRKTGAIVSKQAIQFLQEALSGYVESNLYQRKKFFTGRYHDSQEKFNDFLSTQRTVQHLPARMIEVFAVFGLFLLVLISRYGTGNSINFLTLGAFMAAAYKIIPGIVRIMNTVGQMKTYAFTISDLLRKTKTEFVRMPLKHAKIGSLAFRKVNFSYRDKVILSNFSFSMKDGDFIGFSGMSGKGKTTVVHLLLGFLKPKSGTIAVNGEPSSEIDRQLYWGRISYIKQQPFFIHDTAIRNVVLSDGEYDHQRFGMASSVSGFNTSINGDATKVIRENGKNISGGQRQRIAFARALYKDFDLLILDEPFSEMDEASEIQILEQLKKLSQHGKMIILITHNESSLKFCTKTIAIGSTE